MRETCSDALDKKITLAETAKLTKKGVVSVCLWDSYFSFCFEVGSHHPLSRNC